LISFENAIEVDVDAIADHTGRVVIGHMEHIEQAGIHLSSACTYRQSRYRWQF